MLNKLIIIPLALCTIALLSVPAFAGGPMMPFHMPSMDINIALIKSDTEAMANTGNNLQLSSVDVNKARVDDIKVYGSNYMGTGDAVANASSSIVANKQFGCDMCGFNRRGTDIKLDLAAIDTTTMSLADTGNNQQASTVNIKKASADDISIHAHDMLKTGDATATSNSWTVVNTNWSGMMF